jgi:hypothetical protein
LSSPIASSWPGRRTTGSRWLTDKFLPAGLNHALISFTDPFTLGSWAGRSISGLPDLVEQVRLFGEAVLPRLP